MMIGILSTSVCLLLVVSCCNGFLPSSLYGRSARSPLSRTRVHTERPPAPANETSMMARTRTPLLAVTTPVDSSSSNPNPPTLQQAQRIVFGTAALGKADNPFELLDGAYSKGFTRFDLARTYGGDGVSENIFGAWMEQRQNRDSVQIITKGGMGQDKYGDPHRPLLTTESLMTEVNASLKALRTHYVDMYMFHRDDLRIPVEQFCTWANQLVLDGRAKSWGVSNWSFPRFQKAYEFCQSTGLATPKANSPQFSLAIPRCEVWPTTHTLSGPHYKQQMDWHLQHNVELLCWEVLAKGFMAKPHLWNSVHPEFLSQQVEMGSDAWRLQRIQKAYCYDDNYHRRNVAVQLAKQRNLHLSQIATLYILSQGPHISVIFGSNNLEHLQDMVGLQNVQLDEEAVRRLNAACHRTVLP